MANIWKCNSARTALHSIIQSSAASTTTAIHTLSVPSQLSSVRHLRSYRDHIYREYEESPMNFGIHFVPDQTVYIIERYGKYFKSLPTGIHFLNPFVDKIARVHDLRKKTLYLDRLPAFTKDNISMFVGGCIDVKIVDPRLASYGTEDNPIYAAHELGLSTIRSEIRKITLDDFNKENNDTLPKKIMESINAAAKRWGLECLKCWIHDSGARLMSQNRKNDEYHDIEPPMNFGIHFVPKNTAYIIERYGKYFKTLPTGSLFLNPFLDKIAYVHKIRTELLLNIPSHPVRTKDNVIMFIKGWVNFEIVDPKLASYGVEGSPLYAVSQVAKTTIRGELREITVKDIWNTKISWELNNKIMESINVAGKSWGLECISCRVKEDVSITWKDSLPRLNNIEHSFISLPWRSWFLV